ncbi:four helix bundle protein [bacterium]|nr:four helix bundle protein [bacterium]
MLVKHIHQASSHWPREEMYGLTSQARRAACSIPANIAEGHGRYSPKEFARFLMIAHGSLMELETLLHIAKELGFLGLEQLETLEAQVREIGRMLNGLLRSL